MKKLIAIVLMLSAINAVAQVTVIKRAKLDGNNISSYFQNTGIFDQNTTNGNMAGFEWPKGSGRTANFTAGLFIVGYVNGEIRNASASYKGEYFPGCIKNGFYYTDSTFVIYKVSRGDNANNNQYWMNWGRMVPYGAPFIDVNNDGIYEPLIDTPGVRNASQTIFMCLTDAIASMHSPGEGIGGGTLPMFAEMHLTAWCYDSPDLSDVQFMKWEITNKGSYSWEKASIGFFADPDLGDASDDYSACDTTLNMMICYNGDNMDGNGSPPSYGINPPAFGIKYLRSSYNRWISPEKYLGLTSNITLYQGGALPCIYNDAYSYEAFRLLHGFKKDSSSVWDPTYSPYRKTKFCFPGDPESNSGWTNAKGYLYGCADTNFTLGMYANDVRCVMGSGGYDFKVSPYETQIIVAVQMIAQGTSNLNSVTKVKQLAANVQNLYDYNFPVIINNNSEPGSYMLYQNYPNPFNATTSIHFAISKSSSVKILIYDLMGRELQTFVDEKLSAGIYARNFNGAGLSSGVYYYRLIVNGYSDTKKMLLLK